MIPFPVISRALNLFVALTIPPWKRYPPPPARERIRTDGGSLAAQLEQVDRDPRVVPRRVRDCGRLQIARREEQTDPVHRDRAPTAGSDEAVPRDDVVTASADEREPAGTVDAHRHLRHLDVTTDRTGLTRGRTDAERGRIEARVGRVR